MHCKGKSLFIALLLLLCACQAAPATQPPVPLPPADNAGETIPTSIPLVIYERAILGEGLHERWEIYGNGPVIQQDGSQKHLTPEAMMTLVDTIEQSGFFDMQDAYLPEEPVYDEPLYALSVWAEGEVKTVVTMEDVPMRPLSLQTLIQYVDTLVREEAIVGIR